MTDAGFGRRQRWLAIGILTLVFAAGALSGGAFIRRIDHADQIAAEPTRRTRPDELGGRGGRGRGGPGLDAALAERLGLDDAQRQNVAAALERHREASQRVLNTLQPVLEAQLDSARSAIRSILDADQQIAFDAWLAEGRSFMAGRFGPGRGGRGGPPGRVPN